MTGPGAQSGKGRRRDGTRFSSAAASKFDSESAGQLAAKGPQAHAGRARPVLNVSRSGRGVLEGGSLETPQVRSEGQSG